ncbi:IS21 family transposase [Streptomyces sp. 4N509B]|uniref:IS21 family transposase n=1 Tax=Streptomyces sp. 4N509B TaxID=3457413 RepID=UPI003FD646E6
MKKSDKEIIDILVAYDATESVYAAARITGCDPKTVHRYVTARNTGRLATGPSRRPRLADPYSAKIEEWVDRSHGLISATAAHQRLLRMGFTGSERTTRRMVAEAKDRWREGSSRARRSWTAEPGLWLEFGWSSGPVVPGPDGSPRRSVIFSAWLGWSRFRVVIPCRDQTLATLICCLDATFRTVGGAPTYVMSRPTAGAGNRHPLLVEAARHYGVQLQTCVPDDVAADTAPGSVALGRDDLLPTEVVWLRPRYWSFSELQDACREATMRINQGAPRQRLPVERTRLHPLPPVPHTRALGPARSVRPDHTIEFESLRYPVPAALSDGEVWVRVTHGELVVVADLGATPSRPGWLTGRSGLTEVARYRVPAPR